MPTKIIGTAPYQVPRNSDLGTLAVQDSDNVAIQGGAITLGAADSQGYFQNTDISDVRPSFSVDFANGKGLDPRITFTRSSSAYYYDGTKVKAEQNMLNYSQTFSNSFWNTATTTISSNSAVAPDGTLTASTLTAQTDTNYHGIAVNSAASYSIYTGNAYTASVYAKSAGAQFFYVCYYDNGFRTSTFDLVNGTVTATAAGTTTTITTLSNGWYRCAITFTPAVNAGSYLYFGPAITGTYAYPATFAGSSTTSTYVWGAQVERASGATAYTPTYGVPVTNYISVLQTATTNSPRFDHDPITGESKGLLIEEQRTNLESDSRNFSSGWSGNAAVMANQTIAPDGTLTAYKLRTTTVNNHQSYFSTRAANANTTYTQSVYAKAAENRILYLMQYDGTTNSGAYFDLVTGTIATIDAGVTATITAVSNGWYRCSITHTTSATATGERVQLALPRATNGDYIYTGDGYSGIYVWGPQLEVGSFPTTYIQTTGGTAATRTAEWVLAVVSPQWYRGDEGTLYAEAMPLSTTATSTGIAGFYNVAAVASNSISMYYVASGSIDMEILQNNIIQSTYLLNRSPAATATKAAMAWKNNDNCAASNGVLGTTITNCTSPADIYALQIGGIYGNTTTFLCNGTVKKIAVYQKRLSNAELAEMTL